MPALEAARAGDQAACKDLVGNLFPMVAAIVHRHLPRRDQPEDLIQEVFIKMFQRLDQYRGDKPLAHWVSRIAVTTCIDHLRAQRRRPEWRRADLSEEQSNLLDNLDDPRGGPDPADALTARELVYDLLDRLKPQDRTVLVLLDLEQRSVREIAELTGYSETLVKVRAFRARRKLRSLFLELEPLADET